MRLPILSPVVVVTVACLLAGCGGSPKAAGDTPIPTPPGDGIASPTATATATTTPSPVTTTSRPEVSSLPSTVESAINAAAQKYLIHVENSQSYFRENPRSWLADVKPLMTTAGYREVSRRPNLTDPGWPIAHSRGWQVQLTAACRRNHPDGETNELDQISAKTTRVLTLCRFTDLTWDRRGDPVPTNDLTAAWAFHGSKSALLDLRKVKGKWLVQSDLR